MAARVRCIWPAARRGIGFKDIITFQFAAAFSAFGCTTADFMRRHSVSTQIDIRPRPAMTAAGSFGAKVTTVWDDLTKAAVDEMIVDGHAREKIRTVPFLMMRYTGQLEDVEVMAPLSAIRSADDMRKVIDEFEAVYAKVNHRVSRYGEAGFSITELGLIATADKVKPVLLKRPLGKSDPACGAQGRARGLYRRALAQGQSLRDGPAAARPRSDRARPSSNIPPPRSSFIRKTVSIVDEWTLLHYTHA